MADRREAILYKAAESECKRVEVGCRRIPR